MTTLEDASSLTPGEAAVLRRRAGQQLVSVVEPAVPGRSAVFASPKTPLGSKQWARDKAGKPDTMWKLFQQGKHLAGAGARCFGTLKGDAYQWETFAQVEGRAIAFGTSLLGLVSRGKDMVGIMLTNSSEWYTGDLACTAFNLVSVPLYVTGDDPFTTHTVNLTDLPLVICTALNLPRMIRLKAEGKIPTLKHLVAVWHSPTPEEQKAAAAAGIALHEFEALVTAGARNPAAPSPATKPEEHWSIICTSGTTGNPKGSIMTNGSFSFGCWSFTSDFPGWNLTPEDIEFSYLPAAHAADRVLTWAFNSRGCGVAFGSGNPADLFRDMQLAKPTIFLMVPRILNRVVSAMNNLVDQQGPAARKAFDEAYRQKRRILIEEGRVTRDTEWDRTMFKKMQDVLGGAVKYAGCGAAAVDVKALEFTRVVFGVNSVEVFGQTESAAVATHTDNFLTPFGSNLGIPYSYIDIAIRDVPELGYSANGTPARGEVLVRGPAVCAGYYREPKKTAETIDADGWLAMGDVAEILPDGTLRIIDRAKNVFKMAQGEFVAPEKIEAVLGRCPWVGQVYVHGELRRSFLVAIVVPDPERVKTWAAANNRAGSFEELCHDPGLRETIFADVSAVGRANGLLGYEVPKAIRLHPAPFSVEEGLITASLKNRRSGLSDKFAKDILEMYDSIKEY
ncbi:hypothetical protein DFJ74DRAFT_318529 [Hyaloraphidium curvatum]|nr:hypothetical protein DFJ74DRAFT_318529 [Hyaloraphidium curvatum]